MELRVAICLIWLTKLTAGYLAPNPPGKYNVTLTTGPLIDHSREDPYAATPTPRALMLSIFQPTICAATVPVPYMPGLTAAFQGPYIKELYNISASLSPLFFGARLPVCPKEPVECQPLDDTPILLFSPGYTGPRLYYSVLASAIASEGFTVITIDHPHDANIITYPDGHAVYNNVSFETLDYHPRAADASFIIDQLDNATAMAELLPHRGHKAFKTDNIAMLGHSAGGATAIFAAKQDCRIKAAINWDGSISRSPDLAGLSQPVLIMAHGNTTLDWLEAWPQLEGPKMIAHIANTTHQSFTDFATLMQAAGLTGAPYAEILGTIPAAKMVDVLTTYATAWFNDAFAGRMEETRELLESKEFPEVSQRMRANF